jgi:hypothetical protein
LELLSLTTVMSVFGSRGKEISTHGRLVQNKTQVPSQSGQSIDEQIDRLINDNFPSQRSDDPTSASLLSNGGFPLLSPLSGRGTWT